LQKDTIHLKKILFDIFIIFYLYTNITASVKQYKLCSTVQPISLVPV